MHRFGSADVRHVYQVFVQPVHIEYFAGGTLAEAVAGFARTMAWRL
jgi:hypothetical protein